MKKNWMKGAGWIAIILFFIVMATAAIFLLNWYQNNFDTIASISSWVSGWVWIFIIIFLLISIVPKARMVTGMGLIYCSWVLGFLLWLVNLYISAQTIGNAFTIIGILLLGFGVFIMAGIGMIINGLFSQLFAILGLLALILLVRVLGLFIISKYPEVKTISD